MAEQIPETEVLEKKPDENNKKVRKSVIKYILNISLVLIISGVAIFLAVKDDFNAIVYYTFSGDWRWLLALLGVMVLFVLTRSLILFVFARLFTRDYKYHQATAVYFVGVFYGAVTPGGQGGEVMQAYTYKKQGIHISSAVSALAMHSILYQIVLIIYGIISFAVKYNFIQTLPMATLGRVGDVNIQIPMWVLTIIGFGLNVGYIGIILGMCYWRGLHNFVMGPIIGFLSRIRIVKDADRSRESLRTQLENFKIESRRLFSNVPFAILVSILLFISMTCVFSVPYFVGLAMYNESTSASFWDAVFLSNYHQMATGLIPVPGSAGVSEFVFRSLFSTYPALPTNSFYFRAASQEAYLRMYQNILDNPLNYVNDFNYLRYLLDADNMTPEIFVSTVEEMRGISFEKADPAVRQLTILLADYHESTSMANAAMIMWRFMTFILPLAVSGFVTAFYRASPKDVHVDDERLPGRHTLVALRNETYVERVQLAETMIETSRLTRESIAKRLKSLARSDRRKREKEKREREEAEEQERKMNYRDVNINNDEDDI